MSRRQDRRRCRLQTGQFPDQNSYFARRAVTKAADLHVGNHIRRIQTEGRGKDAVCMGRVGETSRWETSGFKSIKLSPVHPGLTIAGINPLPSILSLWSHHRQNPTCRNRPRFESIQTMRTALKDRSAETTLKHSKQPVCGSSYRPTRSGHINAN